MKEMRKMIPGTETGPIYRLSSSGRDCMLDAPMGKAGFISGSECRRASLEGVMMNPLNSVHQP